MNSWHATELNWIHWFQQIPDIAWLMRAISFCGQEGFCGVVLPFIYLAWNAPMGRQLFWLATLNSALQETLKLVFHSPRPFWIDPRIHTHGTLSGGRLGSFGFPSGHAGTTTTFAWFLARMNGHPSAWATAALIIGAVGLSRIYLGLHFFSDVAGGILFSTLLALMFFRFYEPISDWILRHSDAAKMGGAVVLVLGWITLANWLKYPEPKLVAQGAPHLNAGMILGISLGMWMASKSARFRADGPWRLRAARLALLWSILLVIYAVRKLAAVPMSSPWHEPMLFITGFTGNWCLAFLVPWLSLRWGIARPEA